MPALRSAAPSLAAAGLRHCGAALGCLQRLPRVFVHADRAAHVHVEGSDQAELRAGIESGGGQRSRQLPGQGRAGGIASAAQRGLKPSCALFQTPTHIRACGISNVWCSRARMSAGMPSFSRPSTSTVRRGKAKSWHQWMMGGCRVSGVAEPRGGVGGCNKTDNVKPAVQRGQLCWCRYHAQYLQGH